MEGRGKEGEGGIERLTFSLFSLFGGGEGGGALFLWLEMVEDINSCSTLGASCFSFRSIFAIRSRGSRRVVSGRAGSRVRGSNREREWEWEWE